MVEREREREWEIGRGGEGVRKGGIKGGGGRERECFKWSACHITC